MCFHFSGWTCTVGFLTEHSCLVCLRILILQASPPGLPPPCAPCSRPAYQRRTMVHTEIRKAGTHSRKDLSPKKSLVMIPHRLGFTLVPILQSYSTTMRTQEICSTKTLSQAHIFYQPFILEWPISGRPDSFVYRFRMLGGKLGLVPPKKHPG